MRGLKSDTEEIINYVLKNSVGKEDTSGCLLEGIVLERDCAAAEILRRLNFKGGTLPRKRLYLPPEKLLGYADEIAQKTGYDEIETQHLLLAAAGCKNSEAAELLKKSGIDAVGIARIVDGMSFNRNGKNEAATPIGAIDAEGLEGRLKRRVVGQDQAVEAVANRLKRAVAGLQNPNRPIAAFLFTGSTGVGKTELAKAVADEAFGAGTLVRFDMSEYSDKASVTSLVGAPPAYVGYEEGGRLTGRIKDKPASVILFDEIEKAHRDVMNLLLQILDEGVLTDMRGVKANFTKCIIILTANALSYDIIKKRRSIGFDVEQSGADEREMLKEVFPAELLGRLKTIRFRDLNEADYRKILEKEISDLNDRLQKKRIRVLFDRSAKDEFSHDTGFGVRGIRTRIEEELESKLVDGILSGEIPAGAEVTARYFEGEILLNIKTSEEKQV